MCTGYALEHVVASSVPPAGGSQGTGQDLSRGAEIPITLTAARARRARVGPSGWRLMRGDTGFPVRVRYAKRGKVRWISHRDVARAFERALRIEQLPLAFTLGFSPRPKVSFGLALSTGYESDAEYLDLELAEPIDLEPLPERLTAALPVGLEVDAVVALEERAPALQEVVAAVTWQSRGDRRRRECDCRRCPA